MFDFKKNHILQALAVIVAGWLVIKLSQVIMLFFIAFLFILLLHPIVAHLKKWHFPTAIAVLLPVLGLAGIGALIGFFVVPTFVDQIQLFASRVPIYLRDLEHVSFLRHSSFKLDTASIANFLRSHTSALSNALLSITTTAAKMIVGFITVIVVTLYGVGSYERLRRTFFSYVPARHRDRARDIMARIEKKVVTWIAAQLLLSVAVGFMVWIGSALIGLPFPGILGLISGVLEVVPTLGPVVATIPGFLLGLTISSKVAIFAIVLHIIVGQIEAHLLAPWLLGRTVSLHPIVIIFSLLAGALLYGILGTLLAVPSALVVSAVVDSFREGAPLRKPRTILPDSG